MCEFIVVERIVHFCYSGTSGSTRVAMNISRGSAAPERHAYVFYGVEPLREGYAAELRTRGCEYAYVPKRPGLDWACYRAAAEAVVRMKPATVIFHGSRTAPVAWRARKLLRGVHTIAVQHGPEEELAGGPRRWACLLLSYLCDVTVAVTPVLMELLCRGWLSRRICPSGSVRVILNGVDEEFWKIERREEKIPVIGMVGTLASYKDQPTLIDAVGELGRRGRAVRLEMAGAGPCEASLRAQAAGSVRPPASVKFLGDLSQSQVREAMERWSVQVHSTRSEGLAMALLEGMMAGMAIVASDVAGTRQALEQERTGLLVPPGDVRAMANEIEHLLDDPARAERLGQAARRRAVEAFSMTRMAEQYESL